MGKLFVKGQSGNPSGRPKTPKAIKHIFDAATPKAAKTLVELLDHPDPAMRIKAADSILNRSLGKPIAQVNVDSRRESFVVQLPASSMTSEEWAATYAPKHPIEVLPPPRRLFNQAGLNLCEAASDQGRWRVDGCNVRLTNAVSD